MEVEVAADGAEAWHRLRKGAFDLALVDLEMPLMDGFELIGLIRSDPDLKHLPIVVATGREDMSAVDRAYAEGATSFVLKPLNWRILSHQLSYVLRNNRDEALIRQALLGLRENSIQQAVALAECESEIRRLKAQKFPDAQNVTSL